MKDVNVIISGPGTDEAQAMGNILIDSILYQGHAVFAWTESHLQTNFAQPSFNIRISGKPANPPFLKTEPYASLFKSAGKKYEKSIHDQWIFISAGNNGVSDEPLLIAAEEAVNTKTGNGIAKNMALLGAAASVLGIDLRTLHQFLARRYFREGKAALAGHQSVTGKGYDIAARKFKEIHRFRLPVKKQRYFALTGNDAIAMGAAYAGCNSVHSCTVPFTTARATLFERQQEKFKRFSEQSEDAGAPVRITVNAGCKQIKTFSAGSQRGFARMTPKPAVLVLTQRPGQPVDLRRQAHMGTNLFIDWADHRQFPEMVFAPENAEDAFYQMVFAFDLTEAYRMPVFIVADQILAESFFSIGEINSEHQSPFSYLADSKKIQSRRVKNNISQPSRIDRNVFDGAFRKNDRAYIGAN